MKKIMIVFGLMIATALSAFALYGTGWGSTVTATTTTGIAEGFTANQASLINLSTNIDLYVLANITTNEFNTRISAGTAIRVPATMSYTFDTDTQDHIYNLCYATTNGSAEVTIATY